MYPGAGRSYLGTGNPAFQSPCNRKEKYDVRLAATLGNCLGCIFDIAGRVRVAFSENVCVPFLFCVLCVEVDRIFVAIEIFSLLGGSCIYGVNVKES